jgi:hypothetical protein
MSRCWTSHQAARHTPSAECVQDHGDQRDQPCLSVCALRRADGKQRSVADTAVDYGDFWVVVEVSTKGFQSKTAAGVSEHALAQDLDDIVTKARQVDATIKNLHANRKPGEGARWRRVPCQRTSAAFGVVEGCHGDDAREVDAGGGGVLG